MSTSYFPYCNFDKLRISGANGIRFRYLIDEGSFFEGQYIEDNCFYNEAEQCGYSWEPFAQQIPCDGAIRFQFQWCDPSTPFVHLFQNDELVYEFIPIKVYHGAYDIYELDVNFGCDSDFCDTCIDLRIASVGEDGYRYHAQSEPIKVADTDCLTKVEYWNEDNYDGMYFCGGYRNVLYVETTMIVMSPVETTSTYITSQNRKRVLSKNIAKKKKLDINYVPEYVHDILTIAFSMDNTTIGDVSYTADSAYEITENPVLYSLNKASVELYKNLYKFENSNCDVACGGNQPATPACELPEGNVTNVFGGDASSFI